MDAKGYGLLNAAVGIGAIVGSLTVASLQPVEEQRRAIDSAGGFSSGLLMFAATRSFQVALLCMAGAGLGFVIQNATANTMVQLSAPMHLAAG